jgi:hypothetical protein
MNAKREARFCLRAKVVSAGYIEIWITWCECHRRARRQEQAASRALRASWPLRAPMAFARHVVLASEAALNLTGRLETKATDAVSSSIRCFRARWIFKSEAESGCFIVAPKYQKAEAQIELQINLSDSQ